MRQRTLVVLLSLFLIVQGSLVLAEEKPQDQPTASNPSPAAPEKAGPGGAETAPSVTHHTIKLNGASLDYTATAGYLHLKDDSGKPRADMFFIAYVKDRQEDASARPITFAFNGGPGAASVWLNLGAVGPKRVPLNDELQPTPPPYHLVDNAYSWLEFTDLVFIDPVGTGFSRPAPGENAKDFFGIQEDIASVGAFIRLYTTQYKRWLSPKFLLGESYGTFRAAGLSEYLYTSYGMELNGLILISLAMNFQTFSFDPGNDLPYVLFLPAYTASAWYHKKLSPDLQQDLAGTLREVEEWSSGEYSAALAKGDGLSKEERSNVVEKLMRYTGLPRTVIENAHLRVPRHDFMAELLDEENRSVGLLDSRATRSGPPTGILNDPGLAVTVGPYMAVMNNYVREELHFETDRAYVYLAVDASGQWNWGSAVRGYVNDMSSLKEAMGRNTHLQVYVACGYFDLDTPYPTAQYTMSHLGLDPELQKNITIGTYESGHQVYTHEPSLKKLTAAVSAFVKQSLSGS